MPKPRRNFTEWLNVSPSYGDLELSSPSQVCTPQRTPSPDKSGLYCSTDSLLFTAHIPTHMAEFESAPDPWTPVPTARSSTHLQMLASPSPGIPFFEKTLTDPPHTRVPFELLSADWKTTEPYVSPVVHSSVFAQTKHPLTNTLGTPFLTKLLKAVPPTIDGYSPRNPMDASPPFCTNYSFNSTTQSLFNPLYSPCQSIGHHEDSGTPNIRSPRSSVFANPVTPRTANMENVFPLSPLTPMSDDPSFVTPPRIKTRTKRKRFISDSPAPLRGHKKSRYEAVSTDTSPSSLTYPQRSFPSLIDFEFHPDFTLFYRRFPLSTFFQCQDNQPPTALFNARLPGGTYNPPRDAFDLYTPRFVKGTGRTKVGLCPICIEAPERGGEGKKVWLSMKFSAFKCGVCFGPSSTNICPSYHMQYGHGISASTGLPFSPPTNFRMTVRPRPAKLEKSDIMEGKCHKCCRWVAIQGVKDVETKVKELFWWKHAAACHRGSNVAGEGDFYVVDSVYRRLRELDE